MDWEGATSSIQGIAISTFGSTVSYTHGSDSSVEPIAAIYNDKFISVDPLSGAVVSSDEPNIDVRLSDFSMTPAKGDSVVIKTVNYNILRMEPDGEGAATLFLQKA